LSTSAPNNSRRLVLASASPRRQKLLREAGFVDFLVEPSHVDEDDFPASMLPAEVAVHLAKLKAGKVAADLRFARDAILAADTVVALGDQVIGKPDDAQHAREILRLLSGTTQIVVTGVAVQVAAENYLRVRRVMSAVRMRNLSEVEIERYLQTGAWRGKAGAYGLQDDNHDIVRCTGGCRTNVIGLPIPATVEMLAEVGIKAA
jgi:septum formation protein